jgi:hypothetical protein
MEGSGSESGSIQINYGSGSRRPKNIRIRVRIRNAVRRTVINHNNSDYYCVIELCSNNESRECTLLVEVEINVQASPLSNVSK